jgi:hypothetical protein
MLEIDRDAQCMSTARPYPQRRVISMQAKANSKPSRVPRQRKPKFTVDEVFYYDPGECTRDVTTGMRSIAYLLESISNVGNDPVDGIIGQGLSFALTHYADKAEKYLKEKSERYTLKPGEKLVLSAEYARKVLAASELAPEAGSKPS